MAMRLALKFHERDNVATLFANDLLVGMEVEVSDEQGNYDPVVLLADIPYGHKIAIRDISRGEAIIKYGEHIGRANRDIRKGDHVHVHNLECQCGRGEVEVRTC